MELKEFEFKVRRNKRTGSLDASIPIKKFSSEELDKIQEKGSIKILMKDL